MKPLPQMGTTTGGAWLLATPLSSRAPLRLRTESSPAARTLPTMRRLAVLLVVVLSVAVGALVRGPSSAPAAEPSVFGGLGTWIDIYDTALYRAPEALSDRLARRRVATVWIETANDRSTVDVVQPAALGRVVDALHARGIRVVAWYLPGHVSQQLDLRRARAMLSFRSPAGDAFDGVALDIESLRNRNVKQRTARMLALLRTLRREAAETPVAGITYPPRALERHAGWWPGFPWAAVAEQVDALTVMLYTGGGFKGYDATYGYVARSLRLVRAAVGDELPLHSAGGVANRMTPEELTAFVDAVQDVGGSAGWSLYDLATTTPAGWAALARLEAP